MAQSTPQARKTPKKPTLNPQLWAVHIQPSDDIIAVESYHEAQKLSHTINNYSQKNIAQPMLWPWEHDDHTHAITHNNTQDTHDQHR